MYFSYYVYYLFIYKASKVQKSKNRFVRADVLFAELASDFGGELVVGGGPFREPPTVMQSTVTLNSPLFPKSTIPCHLFYMHSLEHNNLVVQPHPLSQSVL